MTELESLQSELASAKLEIEKFKIVAASYEQCIIELRTLKQQLAATKLTSAEYIKLTDPVISCDFWHGETGERCNTCRACLSESCDTLKQQLERKEAELLLMTAGREQDNREWMDERKQLLSLSVQNSKLMELVVLWQKYCKQIQDTDGIHINPISVVKLLNLEKEITSTPPSDALAQYMKPLAEFYESVSDFTGVCICQCGEKMSDTDLALYLARIRNNQAVINLLHAHAHNPQ